MTKKQKLWFAGVGGAALGGGAVLLGRNRVAAAKAAYSGAEKVVSILKDSRAVKTADRVLWRHTGKRILPKWKPAPAGKEFWTDRITPLPTEVPGKTPIQAIRDLGGVAHEGFQALRKNASEIYSQAKRSRGRLERYRMNVATDRIARGATRQLPAGTRGALDLRPVGRMKLNREGVQFTRLQVVDPKGKAKTEFFADPGNQLELARTLRGLKPKGAKKINEWNVERLLDQRRAMNVPDPITTTRISHFGGLSSNPRGLSAYAAAPGGPTTSGGRRFTAAAAERRNERVLKNANAQARANETVRRESADQERLLTSVRRQLVNWRKTGYKKAVKQ